MRRTLMPLALALTALACAFASPAAAQESISVEARIGDQELHLGEATVFVIDVTGAESASPPDPAAFGDDFSVTFHGGQNRSSEFVSIVNGRESRSSTRAYRLQYELRPARAGALVVPELGVVVEGETYTTRPLAVRVIGPEAARSARLLVEVSKPQVYVEQPLDVTLVAQVRRPSLDARPFDDDPWLQRQPLALSIPWFQGLDGFAAYGYERWVQGLLREDRDGGGRFTINDLQDRGGMLFGDRLLQFSLERSTTIVDGAPWYEYRITKRLTPLEPGRVNLPISTLRGRIVTEISRGPRGLTAEGVEDVFVAHEPAVIEVLPVPEDGRPPTYTHAIGSYRVSAAVDPDRARVGDPLELAVRVEGTGILENVRPPALDRQESLTELFRVGEADRLPDEGVGAKTFYFTIRPKAPGIDAVPALEFAWFDPAREAFDVARSAPVPITVEEADTVGDGEIVRSAAPGEQRSSPGEERTGGLLGNFAVSETLADERFRPHASPLVWLLFVGPVLLLGAALARAVRIRREAGDPWVRRAREALPRAREALAAVREARTRGDQSGAVDALRLALAGFVVDRTGVGRHGATAESLTAGEARAVLAAAGLTGDAAEGLASALAACEAARYGGGEADVARALERAEGWFEALDAEARS